MTRPRHCPLFPLALLALAAALACGDDEPLSKGMTLQETMRESPAAPAPEAAPAPLPSDPALAAYEQAKRQVASGDLVAACSSLERAIAADPRFAEAYYQLGAAETNLAVRTVDADERRAVQLFRSGVDHKRTAELLMRQGSYRVWNPAQQQEAWNDLQQAMEGVDDLLADEATLVQALRVYAGGAR